MEKEIPQFGEPQTGVEYIPRPGAYAIIARSDGHILAVEGTRNRYYLPGGGLDPGEAEEDGLRREILEELGKEIASIIFLGRANQYVDAFDGHFNKLGSFYAVELAPGPDAKSDPEHAFCWVTKEAFRARAAHEAQVYAIEKLSLPRER